MRKRLDRKYVVAYWATFASYVVVFLVLMLTIGYDYNRPLSGVWVRRFGLFLMIAGWAIWYAGRKKLGHESIDIDPLGEIARMVFHPRAKWEKRYPEKLVTDGIYRYTRHPQYWGTVIFYIGLSIGLESIPALFATLAFVLPTHIWRARVEERMNLRVFGEKYREYMERVRI